MDNLLGRLPAVGRVHPTLRRWQEEVKLDRDLSYSPRDHPERRLDIYRPRQGKPPWPVVFYIHGGGFRKLSKESHYFMALQFARRGYLVCNIDYRLAPRHPYPAAVEDCCLAFRWIVEHAASLDGDLSRLAIAGESAGANLSLALTLAICYQRPEPWARRAWEAGVVPRAILLACGLFQVNDVARFWRGTHCSWFIQDRLTEVSEAYLAGFVPAGPRDGELADPLLVLESGAAPARRLPPFFVPVGAADPLLEDTRRLKVALDHLGVPCLAPEYAGEGHAFHALFFRPSARRCWEEMLGFLDLHLA